MLGSDGPDPGTRSRVPTRSTRSGPADEPELAGDGADSADDEFRAAAHEAMFGAEADDPHAAEMAEAMGAADPFASLTDADRQRAAHIPAGSGGKAGDDDDMLTVLPCPGAVPGLDYFRLKDGSAPSRVWVYRTAEGAAVVVAARYDVPLPTARRPRTCGPGRSGGGCGPTATARRGTAPAGTARPRLRRARSMAWTGWPRGRTRRCW